MNQEKMEKEKNSGGRGLLEIVKGILRREDVQSVGEPTEETVEGLIERACDGCDDGGADGGADGGLTAVHLARRGKMPLPHSSATAHSFASGHSFATARGASAAGEETGDETGEETKEKSEEGKRESCPYATRRAIVESLAEIRRFAQEHKLAATVVKAILTLLAEMALGALKGKVSGKVLDLLLKAVRYDEARMEAYADGESAGRNARIRMEVFPAAEDDIPDMCGNGGAVPEARSIFDVARGGV